MGIVFAHNNNFLYLPIDPAIQLPLSHLKPARRPPQKKLQKLTHNFQNPLRPSRLHLRRILVQKMLASLRPASLPP